MALKINTNIKNDADGYLLDASSVKGGYVVVSGEGLDTKENIPVAVVINGTPVYDAKEKKLYRWNGNSWIEEYGEYSDDNVRALLGSENNLIDQGYIGDFYMDQDAVYVKNDQTQEYEPVVGTWFPNEEETAQGVTYGHIFNDMDNTAYIAGNRSNPMYITKDEEGNVTVQEIALSSDIDIKINPEKEATSEAEKIEVEGSVYSFKATLPKEYEDYLKKATFKNPEFKGFTLLDSNKKAVSGGTYETGTSFEIASFTHYENNKNSIDGNLNFMKGSSVIKSFAPADSSTTVDLDSTQTISSNVTFKISGTDTLGQSISSSGITFSFVNYAYLANSTEEDAPIKGTKLSALTSFASSGATINYTQGEYVFFYVKDANKTVQTEVLGQWTDVEFTEMDTISFEQSNGVTSSYKPYRVGPFAKTGSAKYRVK